MNELIIPLDPHTALRNRIKEVIIESDKEWLLLTFKASGTCKDPNGITRQIVSEHSISRFIQGIDWLIFHVNRKYHRKLRFIPFKGGEKGDKNSKRTNFHVHAYLECPKNKRIELQNVLNRHWPVYIQRSYQFPLIAELFCDVVVKDIVSSSIWYNQRYEGETFEYGINKLLPTKSCFF